MEDGLQNTQILIADNARKQHGHGILYHRQDFKIKKNGHFMLELESTWPFECKISHWWERPRLSHFTLHKVELKGLKDQGSLSRWKHEGLHWIMFHGLSNFVSSPLQRGKSVFAFQNLKTQVIYYKFLLYEMTPRE